MTTPARAPRISGVQVILAWVVIVLATAVVPPAAASWLNGRRVATTADRVERVAAAFRRLSPSRRDDVTRPLVMCGPGRVPGAVSGAAGEPARAAWQAVHSQWTQGVVTAPERFEPGTEPDAWGHCLLVDLRGGTRGPQWVLSAGPNGIVETPAGAARTEGDDIGAIVK